MSVNGWNYTCTCTCTRCDWCFRKKIYDWRVWKNSVQSNRSACRRFLSVFEFLSTFFNFGLSFSFFSHEASIFDGETCCFQRAHWWSLKEQADSACSCTSPSNGIWLQSSRDHLKQCCPSECSKRYVYVSFEIAHQTFELTFQNRSVLKVEEYQILLHIFWREPTKFDKRVLEC